MAVKKEKKRLIRDRKVAYSADIAEKVEVLDDETIETIRLARVDFAKGKGLVLDTSKKGLEKFFGDDDE